MNSPKDKICENSKKIWYAPHKFEAYGDEEIKAVESCLRKGWIASDPITEQFERQVAVIFGKTFGVMVNSGSSANTLALLIAGLKSGDEVVTSACTFSTTVAPIVQLGLVLIFCDVELGIYVPSVTQIIEKVGPRTKALLIPNLIGSKPDQKGLKDELFMLGQRDIFLIDDSCDTITTTPVTDISVTSFYSSYIIWG